MIRASFTKSTDMMLRTLFFKRPCSMSLFRHHLTSARQESIKLAIAPLSVVVVYEDVKSWVFVVRIVIGPVSIGHR